MSSYSYTSYKNIYENNNYDLKLLRFAAIARKNLLQSYESRNSYKKKYDYRYNNNNHNNIFSNYF